MRRLVELWKGKTVIDYLAVLHSKGFVIGLVMGLFKVMQSFRSGSIRLVFLVTDVIGSTVMGYFTWEVGQSAGLSHPVLFASTAIMSINAFVVVALLANPEIFRAFVRSFIKVGVPAGKGKGADD